MTGISVRTRRNIFLYVAAVFLLAFLRVVFTDGTTTNTVITFINSFGFSENPHSYDVQGMAKLFIPSGGADSPRPIQLCKAKDGKIDFMTYRLAKAD